MNVNCSSIGSVTLRVGVVLKMLLSLNEIALIEGVYDHSVNKFVSDCCSLANLLEKLVILFCL